MEQTKNIALVAHDNMKKDLIEWTEWNCHTLIAHNLICTGTTGRLVEEAIRRKIENDPEINRMPQIMKLKSGPLGGDQQVGAMISEGRIDLLIFFWDAMEPHPHDVDVKALLRIAVLYNIPTACNRSTADFLISSTLLNEEYRPAKGNFVDYETRRLK